MIAPDLPYHRGRDQLTIQPKGVSMTLRAWGMGSVATHGIATMEEDTEQAVVAGREVAARPFVFSLHLQTRWVELSRPAETTPGGALDPSAAGGDSPQAA